SALLDERAAGELGAAAAGWSQQAAERPSARATSGGSSSGQRSKAYGQRGWKRQPLGGRPGSGTSPGNASGRKPLPSGCGTAPIRASLSGWSGNSQSGRVAPY